MLEPLPPEELELLHADLELRAGQTAPGFSRGTVPMI